MAVVQQRDATAIETAPDVTGADVSVVIPAFNEEATIEATLAALSSQTTVPREVVLVDAGSEDRTVERAKAFRPPFELQLLQRGRLNPGEARNEGVRHSRGSWIAFVDAGAYPCPTWLEELLVSARGSRADVIFGSYFPIMDTVFRRCAAVAYVPALGAHGVRGPFVGSMAIRRETFNRVDGFPAYRAGEDLIFMERILASPIPAAYAPRAEVGWETAPNVAATFRRFALYSRENISAGLARYWHVGVARQYVGLTALALLALAAGAGAWTWLLAPLFFSARSVKAGWQKRGSLPFEALHPALLLGAAAILFVLDAATLAGTLSWLFDRLKAKPR
jgi:glycosyltransferase involved in cell wall biosynthesis